MCVITGHDVTMGLAAVVIKALRLGPRDLQPNPFDEHPSPLMW